MPSTSKKQHNFMAAIANNPSFAKKVGIPQSVGKDFSSADKGRKFQKGGATMMNKKVPEAMSAMMARRRMGSGMAPPAPMGMNKGGMAHGGMHKMPDGKMMKNSAMKEGGMAGMAKTRKFAGGGKVRTLQDAMADHYPDAEDKNVKDDAALEENFDNAKKQISEKDYASAAVSGAKGVGHGLRSFARRVPMVPGAVFNEARIGAIKGAREMVNRKVKDKDMEAGFKKGGMPMKDGKPAFMKKFAEGGVTEGMRAETREMVANRKQAREDAENSRKQAREDAEKSRKDATSSRAYKFAAKDYERELALNPPGTVSGSISKFTDAVGDKMRSAGKFFGSNRVTSQDDAAQMQAREDVKGYKKGGMPMKDGKPAFMKKFAKGGGIESRGKTKGTIIRMAAGGSVGSASRRADGIAQRGKTRG